LVVWVYAGGGESEVVGLIPFLQRHLPRCTFDRRTPARRKPGPRPGAPLTAYGLTGRSLTREIRDNIGAYWDSTADIVLVLDDTDASDPSDRERLLRQAVVDSLQLHGVDPAKVEKPVVAVALAVPEIEAWLLADWEATFQGWLRERQASSPVQPAANCMATVKHDLAHRGIRFSAPESFQVVTAAGEYRKISELVQSLILMNCGVRYSKAVDTPRLLGLLNPAVVSRKCPYFRKFWQTLHALCGTPHRGGGRST
jgi:hypothetical protein